MDNYIKALMEMAVQDSNSSSNNHNKNNNNNNNNWASTDEGVRKAMLEYDASLQKLPSFR